MLFSFANLRLDRRLIPPEQIGRLVCDDLELLAPSTADIDAMMASIEDWRTLTQDPPLSQMRREQLLEFLATAPHGLQRASRAHPPIYHFWMRSPLLPELPMAGGLSLRVGHSRDLEMYFGHIGYHVYPPHRGHHFAEKSVRLILPLALRLGLNPLWITCNPDNHASRRTCEHLGCTLVETVPVPAGHPLFMRGERAKRRYRLDQ